MFPAAVLAAALLGTPRLCRWAPDVPSDAEPLFDLERSASDGTSGAQRQRRGVPSKAAASTAAGNIVRTRFWQCA